MVGYADADLIPTLRRVDTTMGTPYASLRLLAFIYNIRNWISRKFADSRHFITSQLENRAVAIAYLLVDVGHASMDESICI